GTRQHDDGRKGWAPRPDQMHPPPQSPAPPEQLLRRKGVPPRNGRNCLAALITFGDDPFLLLRAPLAPPTGPGKHFKPPHRFGLRFGQKLSVRHVSNPARLGRTIANQRPVIKVRSKRRLRAYLAD